MTDFDSMFCEKCYNLYDITLKSTSVSDVKKDIVINYEDILTRIGNNETVSNDELLAIDMKELMNNEFYKRMAKKGEIKKTLINLISDAENSDEQNQFYMMCTNCGHNKVIPDDYKIMSKNLEGNSNLSYKEDIDDATYRVKTHMGPYKHTRNFNCPNKKCICHTDNDIAPEAICCRKNNTTYEILYVCCHCKTIKSL